jgi:hypothetical protein
MAGMAILAASPALANDGVMLWGGIRAGMTEDQVKALYPKMKSSRFETKLSEKCDVQVFLGIERRTVRKLNLWAPRCADQVHDGLLAKYGEPVSESTGTKATTRLQGKLGTGLKETVERWVSGGVEIRFKRLNTGVWDLKYAPATVIDSGAL